MAIDIYLLCKDMPGNKTDLRTMYMEKSRSDVQITFDYLHGVEDTVDVAPLITVAGIDS